MLFQIATLAMAAGVVAVPQGVTSAIAPAQSPPPGCSPNYNGLFEIGPVNVSTSERDLDKRNTALGISLKDGVLTDPLGRTGYIAANEQFQFDGPPQAGAIWTAGFSVCTNGRLTLGADQTWWKCISGNFYNLYFKNQGGQCIESYLIAQAINGTGGPVPLSASSSVVTSKTTETSDTPATSTSNTHSSASSAARTSTSPITAPEKTGSNNGLSSGATIGVGVGVGVGVGCLLVALVSFLLLRRRLRRRYQDTPSSIAQDNLGKPNFGEVSAKERSHELAAGRGQLPELPVKERPQELSTERY